MNTKWNVRASERIKDALHKCETHKLQVRQGGTNSTLIDRKQSDLGGNPNQGSKPIEEEIADSIEELKKDI